MGEGLVLATQISVSIEMSYTVNTKMYFQERDEADIFTNPQTRKQESYLLVMNRVLRYLYLFFFFVGGALRQGFSV